MVHVRFISETERTWDGASRAEKASLSTQASRMYVGHSPVIEDLRGPPQGGAASAEAVPWWPVLPARHQLHLDFKPNSESVEGRLKYQLQVVAWHPHLLAAGVWLTRHQLQCES